MKLILLLECSVSTSTWHPIASLKNDSIPPQYLLSTSISWTLYPNSPSVFIPYDNFISYRRIRLMFMPEIFSALPPYPYFICSEFSVSWFECFCYCWVFLGICLSSITPDCGIPLLQLSILCQYYPHSGINSISNWLVLCGILLHILHISCLP